MLWARCVCSQVCSDSTGVCNALIEPNVAPNHGGTASGSKQSGFGFPVLLRPALVTFNNLQLDWDKIEGFNEGRACSAFNVCCKCYPTSSQVRITASDQTLRGYKTTPGAGGGTTFLCGAAYSWPCNIPVNSATVVEVSFINFSCPVYGSCALWPIVSFHLAGCFLILCRNALLEGGCTPSFSNLMFLGMKSDA